jgi:hypothetical protein
MTGANTKRCKIKRMVHNTVPSGNIAFQRFRTCERKKIYADMKAGWSAVNFIKKNGNDPYPDFELRPYECKYCGQIHVGHSNMPRTSEARLKAAKVTELGPDATPAPAPAPRQHRRQGLRRKEREISQ